MRREVRDLGRSCAGSQEMGVGLVGMLPCVASPSLHVIHPSSRSTAKKIHLTAIYNINWPRPVDYRI